MRQKNFSLAWIDWSRIFEIRICFEKTLIAFYFDKRLTPSVAEVTMQYHVSKDFLPLHFAVDQLLSISGYDLENGRMPCKQIYCIRNMTMKIPILILFRSCLLCRLKNHLFYVLSLLQLQVDLTIQVLVDGFSSFQMVLARFR